LTLSEQALWAVTNIIGESAKHRDLVVSHGLLNILATYTPMIGQLGYTTSGKSMERMLAWAYSNLLRHKSTQLPMSRLTLIAPCIVAILKKSTDNDARKDACWAMDYLTAKGGDILQVAINSGAIPLMVKLLVSGEYSLVVPALCVLGNFAADSTAMTQVVIDTGILSTVLSSLITSPSASIVQKGCWLVSNVLAGTHAQVQAVIDAGLLKLVFESLCIPTSMCGSRHPGP